MEKIENPFEKFEILEMMMQVQPQLRNLTLFLADLKPVMFKVERQ